eukprot:scaffold285375_cov31-Tisochrysis_lutea.AAC.3
MPPISSPLCASVHVRHRARRGSSPLRAPCAKKLRGSRRSRAIAWRMRAEPNMEPSAVERHAVATPSTTKYGLTHKCCITDKSNCNAPRSTVPA